MDDNSHETENTDAVKSERHHSRLSIKDRRILDRKLDDVLRPIQGTKFFEYIPDWSDKRVAAFVGPQYNSDHVKNHRKEVDLLLVNEDTSRPRGKLYNVIRSEIEPLQVEIAKLRRGLSETNRELTALRTTLRLSGYLKPHDLLTGGNRDGET